MPAACLTGMQSVYRALFHDIAQQFPLNPFLKADLSYLIERSDKEGIRFFIMTLPILGKAIEKSLIQEIPLQVPSGFALKKGSRLPVFLNHLFNKVFGQDGMPRTDGDIGAQYALRMLTLIFSKVEGPIDESSQKIALTAFAERVTSERFPQGDSQVLSLAREILERLFDRRQDSVSALARFQRNPWGKHGPGAVAEKLSPFAKWDLTYWKGVQANLFSLRPGLSIMNRLTERSEQPVGRVICVPKDFRGPRVISIEPVTNQFAQQGIMAELYRFLPHHWLTRRSIRFDDTSLSCDLCAREDIATVDLKDASDGISLRLARLVLPEWIFRLVTRYRTRALMVKGLGVIRPTCLATMGNAICFPVQTVIFWALARSFYSQQNYVIDRNPIRVFGDDIIVPRTGAAEFCSFLTDCGLKVNDEKTCLKTLVKESCGAWYFRGRNTPVIKFKSGDVKNTRDYIRFISYSKLAKERGFPALSAMCQQLSKEFLGEPRKRFNKKLFRLEVRLPALARQGDCAKLDGPTGLYQWFVHGDTAPFLNGTKLKVKMRWHPAL